MSQRTHHSTSVHVLMLLDSTYPKSIGGGTEAQLGKLAKALRARRQRVTIVTPLLAAQPSLARIERVDGVPVCRLAFPRVRLLGGALLSLRLALFLWSRRGRYDAWHAHFAHHFGAVAALLGQCSRTPVIVKVAGATELERGTLSPDASLVSRLAYRCLLRATAWQAISQRIAAVLSARGIPRDRIAAVPNAIDTAPFRAIARDATGGARFLFVGRLVPEKNLGTLLEAFRQVSRSHPEARLRIVGTGRLETSLRQRARDLGIADSVEFCGHRDDVQALLSQADFGVLPSRIEGLSNVLLECMASGLPMVASRISGNEDLVRPGENGWLFEPDDGDALARCMAEAIELPIEARIAMGACARATVERHAGVDSVLERLLPLYRGAAASASPVVPAAGKEPDPC